MQGVYVDLNDLSTLWKDTARTDPITAVGQTVKGITDKSGNGNHLSNATGWVLTADGANNYLATDGTTNFASASFAWGSDKASIFIGVKRNSGTGSVTACSFGNPASQTGSFDVGFFSGGALTYRRGSGSFGGRGTTAFNLNLVTLSTTLDLAGTTQETECPITHVSGASLTMTEYGSANSGTGNFGTYTFLLGNGQARLPGRIYSFFAVAAASTEAQMLEGDQWGADRCGLSLANIAADAPVFLDTGTTSDQTNYLRTSPFAHADYQTTATQIAVSGYRTTTLSPGLGIYVDGVYHSSIIPPTNNAAFNWLVTLPAGDKLVSFRNGLTTSPDASFNWLGTWFVSAKGSAAMTAVNTTPTNRLLIYGDSIAVGGNATIAEKEAWTMLLRDAYAPDSVAVEGFGFRSLFIDAGDSTKRTAFIARMVAYAPSIIVLTIGTNDYGLNYWNDLSTFGTRYGEMLDALHAALPSATIYVQTPIVRAAGTNAFGHTLQEYRDRIITAQSTRTAWTTLIDGTTMLALGDLADGVHPTTAGHAIYAGNMATALGI